MDIVVKGRNVEVPDHYRVHVADKLARLERYDRKVISFDVELFHEPNRRQQKRCQRVEITGKGRGPVIRAEASAGDFYAALDLALHKLENRLRRAHDRRRVHHGQHRPPSVAEATMAGNGAGNGRANRRGRAAVLEAPRTETELETSTPQVPAQRWEAESTMGPGRIMREKEHPAKPMSVDQALYEMELVGHDFYLFVDIDRGCPSVVYRRHGFDYGLIRLV
ncbi:ribosomal subunit interface protein [Longimycelium tulufanense]|uniref:Ribosome hibernation promoting factor n=1 Tax=Longimycelium tulufanense TaxID=907463 RepID=A0A8J3CDU4_9PSEU|nr:ribosome-associated translation inhibitor RaiA [Longimycelium tulufanense]GGM80001.1 ribosomal subunit interface protein [Longimycelium tulufanense]